jgi:UDP-N-acetylglucosamine--N-acetylmuramyl-(pentapeptide) pyrophosphoryl-undecaprenol N-acetylglucosamine transferase
VLLVAEASGGHLIPALRVAESLAAAGARVQVWYAERSQTAALAGALAGTLPSNGPVEVHAMPGASGRLMERLRRVWAIAWLMHRRMSQFRPDVVVGFGGWVSAPAILGARLRGAACLLHEQNVVMGRANRWLARWVDRVAVSFPRTQLPPGVSAVLTGMPVRPAIGTGSRAEAAKRFGLAPSRPTVLILGGSQGSRAVNQLMLEVVQQLSAAERALWQFIHLTGPGDVSELRQAYARLGLDAWVAPHLVEMEEAYAHADLAIGRAGASTLAELASCGVPSILIPYPHASAHQMANARVAEAQGGGLVLDQAEATPARVLDMARRLLGDARLRATMGKHMQALHRPDAAERLARDIVALAHVHRRRSRQVYGDAVPQAASAR